MKLSCLNKMVGDRPLAEKFQVVREVGFDGIDLRGDEVGPMIPVHVLDRDRTGRGEGGIDFATLLSGLKSQKYPGYLGWECTSPFDLEPLHRSVNFVRSLL